MVNLTNQKSNIGNLQLTARHPDSKQPHLFVSYPIIDQFKWLNSKTVAMNITFLRRPELNFLNWLQFEAIGAKAIMFWQGCTYHTSVKVHHVEQGNDLQTIHIVLKSTGEL